MRPIILSLLFLLPVNGIMAAKNIFYEPRKGEGWVKYQIEVETDAAVPHFFRVKTSDNPYLGTNDLGLSRLSDPSVVVVSLDKNGMPVLLNPSASDQRLAWRIWWRGFRYFNKPTKVNFEVNIPLGYVSLMVHPVLLSGLVAEILESINLQLPKEDGEITSFRYVTVKRLGPDCSSQLSSIH